MRSFCSNDKTNAHTTGTRPNNPISRTVGLIKAQPARVSDHHTRRSTEGRLWTGLGPAAGGAVADVTGSASPSLTRGERGVGLLSCRRAVSYTHLTLPTIYSV